MNKNEDVKTMKELFDRFQNYNIKGAVQLCQEAKQCSEILKKYFKSNNPHLFIEISSVIKNIDYLSPNAYHWSSLTRPPKNTLELFNRYKNKVVSSTKNAIGHIENDDF